MTPMTPRTVPPTRPAAITLAARRPEDVLAAVPIVLGFEPEDSLVMLTFGGEHQFHARIDLPEQAAQVPDCVRTMLAPARQHRVERVVFVVYGEDPTLAGRLGRRLQRDFLAAGIDVVECLRASDGHWFALLGPQPGHGRSYDVSAHPFRAEGVVAGRVTEPSRAALAARLGADPVVQQRVEVALREATPPDVEELGVLVDSTLGAPATPWQLARLLLGVTTLEGRDRAWSRMTRPSASDHVALWTAVVRSAPEHLVPEPAALLAFASWLDGHGALAWCAIDRCLAVEPDHRLALLIGEILDRAVAPTLWDPPEAA